MSKIHICNTFFESEVKGISTSSLKAWILSHPIVMQLQFLPLLYADEDDVILVSSIPLDSDPRLISFDELPPSTFQIEDWGASLSIQNWANLHNIPYRIPDWSLVQKINSKLYSFTNSPRLQGAELLHDEKEIQTWLEQTKGRKVLKSFHETAGRGHVIDPENVKKLKPPLIGEPWVERSLDFSTQWKDKKLLGVTVFETTDKGVYKRTIRQDVEKWALEERLFFAKPLVEKIYDLGYFGHLGIDAFIYQTQGKKKLHPIVEINARKTMSWIALKTQTLAYTHTSKGSLPSHLGNTLFRRNITI